MAARGQAVQDYLGRQKLIRVPMNLDVTPNFGHLRAGKAVTQALRLLGYRGRLQVIYPGRAAEKIATLFPGFDSGLMEQELPGPLHFVEESLWTARETVELGISGADDLGPLTYDPLERRYQVESLLRLKPFAWEESTLHQNGVSHEIGLLSYGYALAHALESPSLDEAVGAVRHLTAAQRQHGLLTLLPALEEHEVLPVYRGRDSWFWDRDLVLITRMVRAVAGFAREPGGPPRGIVIPSFLRLTSEDQNFIESFLSGLPNLHRVHVGDDRLPGYLESLQPGEVLLLDIATVPQPVFEYVFSRSTLPALLEGRNLLDCMTCRGLPHLTLAPGTSMLLPHFMAQRNSTEARRKAVDSPVNTWIFEAIYGLERDQDEPMKRLLRATQGPDSPVRDYFQAFVPDDPVEEDKVFQALSWLLARRAQPRSYEAERPSGQLTPVPPSPQ